MSRLALLVWMADLVLDTTGHLSLKQATWRANRAAGRPFWRAMLGEPMLWLALAAFVAEFVAWLSFMALVPLSQAVLVGCINILGVMIGGRVVFGERITPARGAAIAMIGIGVALVGVGRRMKVSVALGFLALVACTVAGQVGVKIAADRLGLVRFDVAWIGAFVREPAVLLILGANIGALVSYLRLLKVVAIGPVFAAAHLSVAVVVAVSVVVWHETLNLIQLAGCAAIVAGVGVLAVTEKPEDAGDAATTLAAGE